MLVRIALTGTATMGELEKTVPLELIPFINAVVESASCAFVNLIFNVY